MTDYNKKTSVKAENEQRFYPDDGDTGWLYAICMAVITYLGLLLFMAIHAKGGNGILFFLFFTLLAYVSYIGCFMRKSPKLYIDKAHTYLRVKSSEKDEIIYLTDIKNYDYFNCYTRPLQYPFLCLCVRIFLHNGQKVEFFAFMKGAQRDIENKMSELGVTKMLH